MPESEWIDWRPRQKCDQPILSRSYTGEPPLAATLARKVYSAQWLTSEQRRGRRLGVAKRCPELAVGYAKQRVTFGAPQMKARHGPPHVGTMIWANRAALGAGGRKAPIG